MSSFGSSVPCRVPKHVYTDTTKRNLSSQEAQNFSSDPVGTFEDAIKAQGRQTGTVVGSIPHALAR